MFGRFPNATLHPDHAVALGAAVQAGLKARDAALEEVRLTDVCPFTLGVDVSERTASGLKTGLFSPIIERNTVIPASRQRTFSTMRDNQRNVKFNIFQGEAREVAENVRLGEIDVPVPAKPAGHVAIECRFSYDVSGLLEVDVTIPETGVTRQVVIADRDGDDLSGDALATRREALAALKVHPRDEAANAALLARAERCYQGFIGERREQIGGATLQFQTVLERQEPRAIAEARAQFEAMLDALEGERFL